MARVTAPRGALASLLLLALPVGALITPNRPTAAAPAAPVTAGEVPMINPPSKPTATRWELGTVAFSLLPLGPGDRRKTIETVVVKDQLWTHDQLQGIVNVNVPVRQTVIKLQEGGLFVHNPVAPTPELLEMMQELEDQHGPVKYVVLGTTGLEHKALAGPFSREFPKAEVWLQDGQYSFPFPTPSKLYGFQGKINKLPLTGGHTPWADEIEHATLGPLKFKSVGTFGETAFFHKKTRTLLVTDTVVRLEDEPPAIVQEDPRALMFHARDDATKEVRDSKETRRSGWRRMALFGLVFLPSSIDVAGFGEAIANIFKVPRSMSRLGDGAVPFKLYPWRWARDDVDSFQALQGSGGNRAGLFVAPILQKLILDREPDEVLAWVDEVCQFDFQRVIPCHLANDVRASPRDFSAAFDWLRADDDAAATAANPLRAALHTFPFLPTGASAKSAKKEDLVLLETASQLLTDAGVVAPSAIGGGIEAEIEADADADVALDAAAEAPPKPAQSVLRAVGGGWL